MNGLHWDNNFFEAVIDLFAQDFGKGKDISEVGDHFPTTGFKSETLSALEGSYAICQSERKS